MKKVLPSTINNVYLRFNHSNLQYIYKNIINDRKFIHSYSDLFDPDKLAILEKNLDIVEKKRAERFELLIKKVSPHIAQLKSVICNANSDLLPVGSLATGLAISNESDIDLVFIPSIENIESFLNDFNDNSEFKKTFIKTAHKVIEKDINYKENIKSCGFLLHAKVPILQLELKNGLKYDIQFCNSHSLRNTNLIRHYAAADIRYRKLYIFVRTLAKKLNIINGRNGFLTSYQISLLVAHFLQTKYRKQQPVLPIIPKICCSALSPSITIEEVCKNLKNPVNVSAVTTHINPNPSASYLAIQFVDYFANFNYKVNAIYMDKLLPEKSYGIRNYRKLQIFDTYSSKSISRGGMVIESLSQSMKYVIKSVRKLIFFIF
ncbi:Hypothetical protein SRAE_1000193500 [Strongyloides ratti]|uniref:Poly(A) RNA polymerase GLD2 n=1 Tax=Strongyloides ratti TaxID=34506 RepID=A0A090L1V8_STRRB|nr:Hypothetical protein SRAE_1000193500 [Strongyloides ratti]CEF63677.1 Hypothetical protein SRAE_1000193500 [Strongyloides ratti]